MIVYVDIDETICSKSEGLDYSEAVPLKERIEKINSLYDNGNTIVYWTARGTVTGIDWRATTEEQFRQWALNIMN